MRKRALIGVFAILGFGALALAVVWGATAGLGGAGRVPGGDSAPPTPAVAQPTPTATPLVLPPRAEPVPPPPLIQGPPRPQPPEGSWEAVPQVARASHLGPLGGAVGRALNGLQPLLSACFDEVTQARHGQTPYTTTQDAQPLEDYGTTILVLQLETGQGEVRIVDAPVETRGGASDGLIACAQRVLRGRSFQVPGARPGARHRLLFTLTQ
jgi:hypothetical protein